MFRTFLSLISLFLLLFSAISCTEKPSQVKAEGNSDRMDTSSIISDSPIADEAGKITERTQLKDSASVATPEEIIARKQVPILCYHQIREWKPSDSKAMKDYIVPVARFREQMQMLKDQGFNTILPDELYAYLNSGAELPPNPIMLTFDDTSLDHYTQAAPVMEEMGFKGVFFVMTVSLGRPRYMTRAQVKELSDAGHVIGHHTWDHQNVKKYEGKDWKTQIEKPKKTLEAITGKPVTYFAYPFGLWKPEVIPDLKSRGISAAFQLAGKREPQEPLYSIRRIIASGYWSAKTLAGNIRGSF
ncbi:MAG: polysaccharide deacetylase family protein [Chitinophagaceae bacterium]|nr:MAG: polysaccharide deacetylase family protein [Chitinophagaceae bacterium]